MSSLANFLPVNCHCVLVSTHVQFDFLSNTYTIIVKKQNHKIICHLVVAIVLKAENNQSQIKCDEFYVEEDDPVDILPLSLPRHAGVVNNLLKLDRFWSCI